MALYSRASAYRSSDFVIIFTVCLAMFTDGFISGIVAPVIPFLLEDKNLVADNKIQLCTSILLASYSTADFFGAPLVAWYVDHAKSRRIPWYAGAILVTMGSLLFGFFNRYYIFIISRILHGVASSVLYTVGLAMLADTIDKDKVGRWMGTAISLGNIGSIFAPLLGGLMYDKVGKTSVFAFMIGLGTFDVAFRVFMKEKPRQSPRIEIPAIAVSEKEGELHQNAASRLSSRDEKTSLKPGGQITSGIAQAPNVEAMPSRRLTGVIELLKSRRLLAAIYGMFINEFIVTSLLSILPLFVKQLFGWTALPAGLLFLTIAIPGLFGPVVGAISDRVGARWVSVIGFLLSAPPLIALRTVDHDNKGEKVLLCVLLTLVGSTIIFFLAPLGAECTFVAKNKFGKSKCDMYASSFSLMNSAMAAAGLLGPLAAAGLEDNYGWGATTIAFGVLALTGAVPCYYLTGERKATRTTVNESGAENAV